MDIVCLECGSSNSSESQICRYCQTVLPSHEFEEEPVSVSAGRRPDEPAPAAMPMSRAEPARENAPDTASGPPSTQSPERRFRVAPPTPAPVGYAEGAEPTRRYHIIVGDACPVCRAASRISFSRERLPQIPVVGCQEPGGCRCSLPIFAEELQAALATTERSLVALVHGRSDDAKPSAAHESARAIAAPAKPAAPDWAQPAPITERRHRDLADLTTEYYQRRIQGIRVQTQTGCCRVCADVADSIYEPSAVPTLPVVGCHHGWYCTCMYEAEPLPLDDRGQAALETLARQERDAMLRRRGIARYAPRPLHELALAFAILLGAGAVWQSTSDIRLTSWEVLLPATLAAVCGLMALGAIIRFRWMIAPALLNTLAGACALLVAVRTAVQFRWPVGLPLERAQDLQRVHLMLTLSGYGLDALPPPERLVAVAGLALFVAGLAGLILGPGYQQRAVLREAEVGDGRYIRGGGNTRARATAGRGKPVLAVPGYRSHRGG